MDLTSPSVWTPDGEGTDSRNPEICREFTKDLRMIPDIYSGFTHNTRNLLGIYSCYLVFTKYLPIIPGTYPGFTHVTWNLLRIYPVFTKFTHLRMVNPSLCRIYTLYQLLSVVFTSHLRWFTRNSRSRYPNLRWFTQNLPCIYSGFTNDTLDLRKI